MNPFNMKKAEMQIYLTGYCKHRMPYAQHPKCFEREIGENPKIGVFDIETAWGFNADTGFMLCYVIKNLHRKKIDSACLKKSDFMKFMRDNTDIDYRIASKLSNDLKKYNVIITYNGTRFDIPYSRTRLLKNNLDFPKYGFMKHIDLYYVVKYKLKLGRNSLESACRLFGIKGKNHVDFNLWQRASMGDEKALEYILDHCKRDVISCTEPLYDKIIEYARKSNRSV
jgi:uncharacterized protein YprB with RNaseH-like and TPR domain